MEYSRMKYVKRINNKLFFGKAWPSKLQAVIGRKQFTYPLGSVSQTEAQVTAKVVLALKEFDVKVRMATNSDSEDYHQAEIDILVEANLRRLKQTYGTPQFIKPDIYMIDNHKVSNVSNELTAEDIEFNPTNPKPTHTLASHEFIADRTDLANSLVNIDDIITKQQAGQKLTIREKAAGATWAALQTKAKKRPKMLYDQWAIYVKFKRLDTNARIWKRFCGLITNRSLNLSDQGHMELSKELSETLRDFRDIRLDEVKIATVQRELKKIRACLNFVNNENDFDWRLKKTLLPTAEPDAVQRRKPLSIVHQQQLVAYCLSPEHSNEPCATMVLLYLIGGVMPSEVGRMDVKVQLECLSNAVAPFVKIMGELKTPYRLRPVPIVLGLSVVRDNIEATIAWAKVSSSTRIGQMKRFMNEATGTQDVYVSHSLRHSFSMNCRNSNCRDDDKATLGGWASYGGATAVSKGYGADAMFDQGNIERLYKVSADIHRNLM
jgi:hypothetical protein